MKKIFFLFILIFSLSISQAQQLDRSIRPVVGPTPKIQIGNIESFTLPNGLKVFVVENHKLPRVSFSLQLNVNPLLEGDSKGYVSATGQLLNTGTTKLSKDELDSEIDFIGATFSTSSEGMYGECLVQNQDKLLEIMSDELLNAKFTQDELDKIKKKMLSEIENREGNPDAIAANIRDVIDFGKNYPYGEIESKKSVENISLDECENYYKTYFRPNVAYLAIVGDIKLKDAKKLIEKYFGQWQKADVPIQKYAVPQAPDSNKVFVVNKPGAAQSLIDVTYPINLQPNNPDAIKAKVMNTILGGAASGRLFLNLREKHAYAGAYSILQNDQLVGSFTAFTKVRNAVTDSSVTQILYEMKKLRDEKVGNDELQSVKNYLTGVFAIALENPQTVADYAINIEKYNLPKDYYENYLTNLNAVTADDIYNVAQKYLRLQNVNILVVGSKDEVAAKLTKFSADGKIIFLNANGDVIKSTLRPAPQGMTAEMVIDNYVKAIGGKENLENIKDITTKMTASIQNMQIDIVNYQKAPDKFYMSMGRGSSIFQKQIFDGVNGITTSMGKVRRMTGTSLEEIKNQSTLNLEMNYEKLGYKLTLKGIDKVDGKDAYVLEVESPTGKKSTEYYDVASGLKVRVVQLEESRKGIVTQTTEFSDYRAVDNLKFPFKMEQRIGSQVFRMNVTSIQMNTGVKDSVFSTNIK